MTGRAAGSKPCDCRRLLDVSVETSGGGGFATYEDARIVVEL